MLKLTIQKPEATTVARTQSYRLIITAELTGEPESSSSSEGDNETTGSLTDARIFVVSEDDNGIQSFERVIFPSEYDGLTDASLIKTDTLDLWLPAGEELANQLIVALVDDITKLLQEAIQREVKVSLAGAGYNP